MRARELGRHADPDETAFFVRVEELELEAVAFARVLGERAQVGTLAKYAGRDHAAGCGPARIQARELIVDRLGREAAVVRDPDSALAREDDLADAVRIDIRDYCVKRARAEIDDSCPHRVDPRLSGWRTCRPSVTGRQRARDKASRPSPNCARPPRTA